MSESSTPMTILTREARPWGTEPRCGSCGQICHPKSIVGEVRCHQCQPRDKWKTYGEPGEMVTRQEFTKGNASARAELIRQRTRDRKQQEAMIAAEMVIQAAVPIVEEVFDPARSEEIIRRFQGRKAKTVDVAASPSPLVAAVPAADIPPLAESVLKIVPTVRLLPPPERDDAYVPLRDRWKARVAAARAEVPA